MAACPRCGTTLKDEYGMSQCPGCGAFSFVDLDGNANIQAEEQPEPGGAAAPPEFADPYRRFSWRERLLSNRSTLLSRFRWIQFPPKPEKLRLSPMMNR